MGITPTRIATVAALLYAARRCYRNWGATTDECRMTLPGDGLVGEPSMQTTDAVWIDATARQIWSALADISREHGGCTAESESPALTVGTTVRLLRDGCGGAADGIALRVVDVEETKTIVLRRQPSRSDGGPVWSIHVIPHWDDRCRLLIRHRVPLRHPGEVVAVELSTPPAALLTHRIAVEIKRRAERAAAETAC